MKHIFKFFALLLILSGNIEAQNPQHEGSDFSYFLADVSYMSDAIFMGRKDSVRAPYVYSSLGYYDKSGFFGNFSASYLVSSEDERFDLFLLSAGYIYSRNDLSVGLSGTKYFFDDESYNVQSEIEAGITGLLAYDFDILEFTLSASGYFSDNDSPDVAVNFMADRSFFALENNLMITPTFILAAGTQYFYEEYYNSSRLGNRKGSGNGQGQGGNNIMQSPMTNVSISEASEFNILNIEAKLPLMYFYKSFIFSFTPIISFPQTPASIITDDAVYKEDLESIFYWSAGISYWLKTGK
ncbi:hypothetical protein [Christiangramia crocea]|uniref:Outer membrane protein beta-barrel domain-containing protein n=1 Tax=Christiangramia crocea TaxID=2904124 RepID=A0A9X1UWX8_9FLAO|nr:hypothetical protein [Gramella crocea]MCG9970798.1 hypothetical protein [Gramella crocea]